MCPLPARAHLEHDATAAASLVNVLGAVLGGAAADTAGRAGPAAGSRGSLGGASLALVPPDGADDGNEGVVYVNALLGGSLDALGTKALGEVTAL